MNLKLLQQHVAFASVAPTTLRNMGANRKEICLFLANLDLHILAQAPDRFGQHLSRWTRQLTSRQRINFGPARKAINLFLRDASYNSYLRKKYRLDQVEEFLEIPLDRKVMKALFCKCPNRDLQKSSVIALTSTSSLRFQRAAKALASCNGTERIHLDLWFWSDGATGTALDELRPLES